MVPSAPLFVMVRVVTSGQQALLGTLLRQHRNHETHNSQFLDSPIARRNTHHAARCHAASALRADVLARRQLCRGASGLVDADQAAFLRQVRTSQFTVSSASHLRRRSDHRSGCVTLRHEEERAIGYSTGGLLREIGVRGALVIKEFTSILSLPAVEPKSKVSSRLTALFISYYLPTASSLLRWRRGAGSNRRIKVLQTSALPLGYRAASLET
jgi:hypothetical protein